ncbi:MAG: MFS transporter [Rubrivivax sp. SCN 71-131]|jgi:PAT family beta-lactamase induction signal transducer AmpG|nr:MAG: MFS transporter [Rubrivivax sp. SCN 71-131]
MTRSPWWWVPSLYWGQGLPYVVVMTLAVVLYKNLGLDNAAIALYTSWLYLPWVIKPLWSPLVELLQRKRWWIVALQLVIGATLAAIALTLPMARMLQMSLAFFWLLAFASATHDIAADGYYMLALRQDQQAAFVGVRSLFYRVAMISAQGGLVWAAGTLAQRHGSVVLAWQLVFGALALLFAALAIWHQAVLPRPESDRARGFRNGLWDDFAETFVSFFRRRDIVVVLAFLMLYRLGEAQLVKLVAPFLLDPPSQGGLGLTTAQLGLVYGSVGVGALTVGGLLGGWVISRHGLARWLWPMVAAIHLPNLLFVALAAWQPGSIGLVTAAVAAEQFGYGFGFAAYLMFMIWVADGPSKTAHYALCTGFMALGMMLPGMASGWLQQHLGYPLFFAWVCLCTLPSVAVATRLRIPSAFGRKDDEVPA